MCKAEEEEEEGGKWCSIPIYSLCVLFDDHCWC